MLASVRSAMLQGVEARALDVEVDQLTRQADGASLDIRAPRRCFQRGGQRTRQADQADLVGQEAIRLVLAQAGTFATLAQAGTDRARHLLESETRHLRRQGKREAM